MKIAVAAMVFMFGAGMMLWLLLYTMYANVLWDVRSKAYKRPMIKLIVKKYIECNRLEIPVGNVARFVDKSVRAYTYCGLPLELLEKVAKFIEPAVLLLAFVAALIIGVSEKGAYMCVVLGLCEVLAIYICRRLASVADMRRAITIALTGYLKNNSVETLAVKCEGTVAEKLTGRAYVDFLRLNQRFDRIYESRTAATLSLKK